MNPTLEAAHAYLAAGLSLLPVATDGSKRPATRLLPRVWDQERLENRPTWLPFQQRLPEIADLERWFGGDRPAGIGVIGGAVSGCLEQIDFDREAEDLMPRWSGMVEQECPGLFVRLNVTRTPRAPAGYHVRYRCPGVTIPGNTKIATDPAAPSTDRVLIETRGEGGYALAPGCPASCHETGRLYEHACGPDLAHVGDVTAAEREVMLRCARSLSREAKADPIPSGLRPGEDYDRRGPDWLEILRPHGWECTATSGTERRWRRPGKDGRTWSATTGHCGGKDGADLFRVFSSNAHPFEDGKAYGKFRAYAILNHNGDLSAAARDLGAKGFGEPARKTSGQNDGEKGNEAKEERRWEFSLDDVVIASGKPADLQDEAGPAIHGDQAERFEMWTLPNLLGRTFPPPRWVVPGILSEGLNILAGKPKMGKSMLALNLALTIAGGGKALGNLDTVPGDVLYLALEDRGRRVQFRAKSMLESLGCAVTSRLYVVTRWPNQDDGGLRMLRLWLERVERPTLVIIDVWAKFRTISHSQGPQYEQDYRCMSQLKDFLDQYGCNGLNLNHTRKAEAQDVIDEISGTSGISGAADGIVVLSRSRNDNEAKLTVTGRDVVETELALRFDPASLTWTNLGAAEEHIKGKLQTAVLEYLRSLNGGNAFAPDVAAALNEDVPSVRVTLHRLFARRLIRHVGNAWSWPGEPGDMTEPFSGAP